MTTGFFNDGDLAGAGEFVEGTVTLATEYTIPDCTIDWLRLRFPAVAGSAPVARVYNSLGVSLMNQACDTTVNDAWNFATPAAPIVAAAGTYRACQVVTRYVALGGFFSGGPITRGSIQANRSMFDSGNTVPTQASNATYFVDIGITPAGGGVTITLPVAVEVSTSITLGRVKSRALPAAAEADMSVALGGRKTRLLPVAAELDVAVPMVGLVLGSSGHRFVQASGRGRAVQSTPRGRGTQ